MTRVMVPMLLLVVGLSYAAAGRAQEYPNRPIRLIVPFPPGGTSDLLGRVVGVRMGEALRQTVVVDNRGGAGGTMGAQLAAKAPPDGYTLLVHNVGLAMNETFYSRLPYAALTDLVPISKLGDTPHAVVVTNTLPAQTLRDLIAMARKTPGKLDYSSGGVGTASHLSVALIEQLSGVKLNHVPYKGGGPSMIATVAGEVHFAMPPLSTAAPHIKASRLRILAVSGARRSPTMADVPTVAEAAVPGYEFSNWFGVFAPAGTSKTIIYRLNEVIVKSLQMPDLREQLAKAGLDPESSTPDRLGNLLRADTAKWARVIKGSGIPIN